MIEADIRTAQPTDAAGIARVLAESFAEYEAEYTAEAFAATTPSSDEIAKRLAEGQTWVAESQGIIVGTVSVVPDNESLYIRSMAIQPQARGARIGERLLKELETFAVARGYRRMFLNTTLFLHRAMRLYETFGFVRCGVDNLHGTPLTTMEKAVDRSPEPG